MPRALGWPAPNDDLRAVADCLYGSEPTPTGAAYHCQQGAEKLVKAVLVAAEIHPPRSHDIGELVDRLGKDHRLYPTLVPLARLTPYAWLFRYPSATATEDAAAPPEVSEAANWLEALRHALAEVRAMVG